MSRSTHGAVSVVVPCYQSSQTLQPLVEQLLDARPTATDEFEIVLVVDGSPDATWDVARDLAERHGPVRGIHLSRNYGQHNAIVAGIREARHPVVVTMDDDLQHRPGEVPRLLAALTPDLDLVYGVPVAEEHTFWRSFASRFVKHLIARGLGITSATSISAFRAFRTRLRDGFAELAGPHASVDVALSWATTRIGSVPVEMDARAEGRSNYSFRMLLRHASNMLLGYSTAPLRLVGYLGFLCAALGTVLLGVVLWQYFTGSTTVQGFTTLASMVAVFSGAQMLAIGVLGEYLGRVHINSVGQPTYVVAERSGDSKGAPRDIG
ncbi:glycosyltransferase family 2 protein [Nocardioides sp.]|uniref:glycosyltransferase family 2 protein n=1 Tax=Nocardioides sp. TaxID=35761 RepID=UPI002732A08F|nr:glycosyltransferase family 2 protein [Nocardioides sp.]MDP3891506.1 glycosyltransferase family 2 protein [Nocardioides sp.]